MKDKIRDVLAILGILFLSSGSTLVLVNFSIRVSEMMEPGFLTAEKSLLGVVAATLIALGILIFAGLWRDII